MTVPAISPARLPRPAAAAALLPALLGGCSAVLISPAGDVARQQANLILWATGLMLLIIVPVMVLTVLFAWKYRAGNEDAPYEPDWDHSTGLELIIWSAPLLIVIALGAITWTGTHLLDPYRPLARPKGAKAAPMPPLEVQVVSLDWKWLFIYPEQGIATVNRLVVPVDREVRFRMTSSSVMNTFWVPSMAGMIYTMPAMETKLHAVLNRVGDYEGRSGNYSGAGFSGMTFRTLAVPDAQFDRWVAGVRGSRLRLDRATYLKLERPSEKVRPIAFGGVERGLYGRVVGMCVRPGVACVAMDHGGQNTRGGHGKHGGAIPGTNTTGGPQGTEGAITRDPAEQQTVPHSTAPDAKPKGTGERGSPSNQDMTALDPSLTRAPRARNA